MFNLKCLFIIHYVNEIVFNKLNLSHLVIFLLPKIILSYLFSINFKN